MCVYVCVYLSKTIVDHRPSDFIPSNLPPRVSPWVIDACGTAVRLVEWARLAPMDHLANLREATDRVGVVGLVWQKACERRGRRQACVATVDG